MSSQQPLTHPSRRRREIECGFCGEPTREGIGICRKCQHIYAEGKKTVAMRDDTEKTLAAISRYAMSVSSWEAGVEYSDQVSLVDLISALTQQPPAKRRYDMHHEWVGSEHNHGQTAAVFALTLKQIETLNAFIQQQETARRKRILRGKRDGSAWVRKLAEGDLTIGQITDWTTKVEGGDK